MCALSAIGYQPSAMNDGWGMLIRETRNGLTTDLVLDEQAALPRVLAAIRSDGSEELYAYGPEGLHAQRTITGTTDMVQDALLDAQGSFPYHKCCPGRRTWHCHRISGMV